MKYYIILGLISHCILENYSQLSYPQKERKEGLIWRKRRQASHLELAPKAMIAHVESKIKGNLPSNKNVHEFQSLPKEKICGGGAIGPSYAKAVCTSYPGRVVCQLGRYTFVINNGEHHMEPEVIERFAAMVFHRTQEGDNSFDVAVDQPEKDECICAEPEVEATTRLKQVQQSPAYIECTPIKDERKLCNPAFSPSEVIYSCKRKEIGIRKRMVISVDKEGTVRNGDLVLPYYPSIERRLKRNKTPIPNVKSFTDECKSGNPSWNLTECPSGPEQDSAGCITTQEETKQTTTQLSRKARNEEYAARDMREKTESSSEMAMFSMDRYEQNLFDTKNHGYNRPPMFKRQLQATLCTTTCPTKSTTCPTRSTTCPTTACGPVPNPPVEVPCCQRGPSKPPPSCPNPQPQGCPPQNPRQRRALPFRWRKRKKINYPIRINDDYMDRRELEKSPPHVEAYG